jgi:hypothetical protein
MRRKATAMPITDVVNTAAAPSTIDFQNDRR